jgi:hypothetical protein
LELAITLVVFAFAGADVAAVVVVVLLPPFEFEHAATPDDRSAAPKRMPIDRRMSHPSGLDLA